MPDNRMKIAIDTETHLFAPGRMAPRVVCTSAATENDAVLHLAHDGLVEVLRPALALAAKGNTLVIGQNFAYDAACLLEMFGSDVGPLLWKAYEVGGIHCTRVRERLIDIHRGSRWSADDDGAPHRKAYNLAALAKARLNMELDKTTWRTDYATFDGVPIEQWPQGARDYALDDARATLGVWLSQEVETEARGYPAWTAENGRQAAFAFALQLMKCRGIMIDQDRVRALREGIVPKMNAARQTLVDTGLLNAKKGSKDMAAIRAAIEGSWIGEGKVPLTATGKVSTAAETVEQCTHPGLAALVAYNSLEKLSSSFVSKLEEAGDRPIHAETDVLGADTGRTSCRAPNLQQQPRAPGVRECFAARPGFVLIACDFDSQELRTLAQVLLKLTGRSVLADRYQADPNYDPHTDFAASLMGTTYVEAMAMKKAKDKVLLERRQQSKAANFGFPGGMGVDKFRLFAKGYDLDLSEAHATELRDNWFKQYPEMRDYFGLIGNRIDSGLTTIEQLYSGRLRGDCGFTDGCNTYFQGLASDASKNALWEVTKRCFGAPGHEASPLVGCRPVVFIHDEIIVEAPASYAHEAAVEMDRVMCAAMEELTPDVPARASPALMRNWSKAAKEAFDKDGRYIPYEDERK